MGMGISWYLPVEKHCLLKAENTYILRTENLGADFSSFATKYSSRNSIPIDIAEAKNLRLNRSKHDFKLSYPHGTFAELDYNNYQALNAMNDYLSADIVAHNNLVEIFA